MVDRIGNELGEKTENVGKWTSFCFMKYSRKIHGMILEGIFVFQTYLKGHHFNSHFFLRLFFFLVEVPSMVSLNVEVFMKIDFFFNILGGSSCI